LTLQQREIENPPITMKTAAGPISRKDQVPQSGFQRRRPPMLVRCAIGVMLDGVIGPLARGLELFGRGDRPIRAFGRMQRQGFSKKNPFAGYLPTCHDVFVAVYVKSGTNWTMQIVHQLLNHGKGEYEHIHDVIPWPDLNNVAWMRGYAVPLENESAWRAAPEQKRVIKTHLNWEQIPYSDQARYIHVIRDPKDVFVSSYFFFGSVMPVPSVDAWFKAFCSRDFMWSNWAESSAGYWAQRHRPNVLVLSYKAMKRDLPATVRKIAEFLDVRVGDDVLKQVVERSSFQYMKSIGNKFGGWSSIPWKSEAPMMRKGVEGSSSELLTPERQREMDEFFMAELKRLGSDLSYEEFCDVAPKLPS
jgi:hypothetical protein